MIPTRKPRPLAHRRTNVVGKSTEQVVSQVNADRHHDRVEAERAHKELSDVVEERTQAMRQTPADSNSFTAQTFDFTGAVTITLQHGLGRVPIAADLEGLDPAYGGTTTGHIVITAADAVNVTLKAVGFDANPTGTVRLW